MNRRGFLGSVIGLVASSNFLALTDNDPWQRVILPYRMLFRDSISGFTIQGPGVKEVSFIPGSANAMFLAEPLDVTKPMTLDSVILLTQKGKVIQESKFNSRVVMNSGDLLNLTQTLSVEVARLNRVEDLVDLFVRWPKQAYRLGD